MTRPGTLFLVVGPSGAGKDSLIAGAKDAFADDANYVFPPRAITRPPLGAGRVPDDERDETYRALTSHDFEAEEAAGFYALSWRAHGLAYGIPETIENDLDAGKSVVVNVSRTVIEDARRHFPNVRVIAVDAPEAVRAERLATRGRESEADVRRRLARMPAFDAAGPGVTELVNDGPLEAGVEKFVTILRKRA